MNASPHASFVIVGGGLAGAEAAVALRDEGFDGRVIVVGDERHAPYDRPPLSKGYLRGEMPLDDVLLRQRVDYEERGIELVNGTAEELRPADRTVVLGDGRRLQFDRLLVATGSRPRPFGTAGQLRNVHLLRTIDDADAIRDAASSASSAIVAGGGWIAAEAAASLRQMGLDVTLVVPGRGVLARDLGPQVATIYTGVHRAHGVRVVENNRVGDVIGAESGTGAGVRLMGGDLLRADLVVLGFGAVPNVELAAGAGLAVGDGVIVDERLETSAPGIFAAGDVAAARHLRYGARFRSEHWDNARKQGPVAARNMLGRGEVFDRVPYFYSDQFELGMEFWGRVDGADQSIVRHLPGGAFAAFWLREGRTVAAMHGNAWALAKDLERLVESSAVLDARAGHGAGASLEAAMERIAAA